MKSFGVGGQRTYFGSESLEETIMKIIGWIVLVIFLIGLATVLGLGKLIF